MVRCKPISVINSVAPGTKPMFAMLDPSAFPTASSPESVKADMTEINISGAEVPTDTMVKPISIGEEAGAVCNGGGAVHKAISAQPNATNPPRLPLSTTTLFILFCAIQAVAPR